MAVDAIWVKNFASAVIRVFQRNIKLHLALIKVTLLNLWTKKQNKDYWLIGGSSGKVYSDNSAAFHRYLLKHHPDIAVYWVISKKSSQVCRVKEIGPVLFQEDLKTYITALQARVHIISHGLHDVPGCSSAYSKRVFKVRLGHGLTALKKTKGNLRRTVQTKSEIFDLVPVSSQFEKKIKRTWGFANDKLVITGLPRYDDLLKKHHCYQTRQESETSPTKILYMPTWRDWLSPNPKKFRVSDFYKNLTDFLFHPELEASLTRHNVLLCIQPHIIIREQLEILATENKSTRVRLVSANADLQDEIVSSRLLITDYSSVAWDYLFLNKPVLFYQFDIDRYNAHRGAYIDLNNLFGPVANNAQSAVALTNRFVTTNFDCSSYAAKMEQWQATAFLYHDSNNCERVFQAIQSRLQNPAIPQ